MELLIFTTEIIVLFRAVTYSHGSNYFLTDMDIICKKCEPGHKLVETCDFDSVESTICAPCEEGTYQNKYSMSKSCIPCTTFCEENSYVRKNCSPTADISCTCRNGYYKFEYPDGKLYNCLKCPKGETTEICGESNTDGFFSDYEPIKVYDSIRNNSYDDSTFFENEAIPLTSKMSKENSPICVVLAYFIFLETNCV